MDSGSCRLFVVCFYGSWIWQIVLLWDPLDLGSCIRAMLWDPRDLGSCRAVLPSDPVDLGSCFLVTARVWRPCGWDKASRNSKLTFHQPYFASCPVISSRASWPSSGGARKTRLHRKRTSENQVFSKWLREWRTRLWATLQNHEELYLGHIYHRFSGIQLPMKKI